MNNDRTIVISNVWDCPIGLRDTQGRTYRLSEGAKMRISEVSLQDILDRPASKVFFEENKVKIANTDRDTLFNMGLNEEEIDLFLIEEKRAVVVEQPKEEVAPVVETVAVVEEVPAVETKQPEAVVTKTVAKPATKKGNGKKGNLKTK